METEVLCDLRFIFLTLRLPRPLSRLERADDNFYCHLCVDRLPTMSDSLFENSNITDETFSTNSSSRSYLSYTELSTNGESHDPSHDSPTRDINTDQVCDSNGAPGESHDSSHDDMTRDTNTEQDGDSHGVFDELKNLRFKNRENVIITH